jgi:hypothetical protein
MSTSCKIPPGPNTPYGLCQCGCGQSTALAKVTRADRYQIKDEPLRFIWGHQARKSPAPPEGFKCCRTCLEVKPVSEFYKQQAKRDHLQQHCKTCSRNNLGKWRDKNPGRPQKLAADWRRIKEFGILPEEYNALMEAQGDVCAICGERNQRKNKDGSHYALTVDHCHTTGVIRGLLCNLCNPLLGYCRDDRALLEAAAAYLEKYGH